MAATPINPYTGPLITKAESQQLTTLLTSNATGSGQLLTKGVRIFPCEHSAQKNEVVEGRSCPNSTCKYKVERIFADKTLQQLSEKLPKFLSTIQNVEIVPSASTPCLSAKEVKDITKVVEDFYEEIICPISMTEEMTQAITLLPCAHHLQSSSFQQMVNTATIVKCPSCRANIDANFRDKLISQLSTIMQTINDRIVSAGTHLKLKNTGSSAPTASPAPVPPRVRNDNSISNNNQDERNSAFTALIALEISDFISKTKGLIATNPNWSKSNDWQEILQQIYVTFKSQIAEFDIDENHPQFKTFLDNTTNLLIAECLSLENDSVVNVISDEFNRMAFYDIINTFANRPLEQITIEDFKTTVATLQTTFKHRTIEDIEMRLRQAITKMYKYNDFINEIKQLENPTSNTVNSIKSQIREKLRARKDRLEKELSRLRGPDGFSGTINAAHQEMNNASDRQTKQAAEIKFNRLLARLEEIAKYQPGTTNIVHGQLAQAYADLDETALNQAAQAEARKRVSFYRLLTVVILDGKEREAHATLRQLIGN